MPSHIKKRSIWWRENLKWISKFKSLTLINIGDGKSCLFWTDNWAPECPATAAPELCSFAKNKLISMNEVLNMDTFSDLFHLLVSQVALTQMQSLTSNLALITLTEDNDK